MVYEGLEKESSQHVDRGADAASLERGIDCVVV